MYIGLASLSVFFAASLVGLLVTRAESDSWRESSPEPPLGLWLCTVILLLLSASLRYGEALLRRNNRTGLVRALGFALAASGTFLVAQTQNWRSMASALVGVEVKSLYAFCFYFLTVLHALHVAAGIIPLVVVYRRARKDEYSSSRSEGARFLRQYWDFLFVVWIVLLLALWF